MEVAVNASDDPLAACAAAREQMLDRLHLSAGQIAASDVTFHCKECRAWFERARNHGRALAELQRLSAATFAQAAWVELDGRVVAELQAGCRQERAAAALSALERVSAPAELEAMVASVVRSGAPLHAPAPGELDFRVAQELVSDRGARIGRQISALPRFSPPADLEGRVQQVLARGPSSDSLPIQRWMAIAATLLVVFGAASMIERRARSSEPTYPFRVVHVESTASLDPFVRGLLSASSGGVLDLPSSATRNSPGEQGR
jgi:hypothetical protein